MSRAALFYRKRSDSIRKPLGYRYFLRDKSSIQACGKSIEAIAEAT